MGCFDGKEEPVSAVAFLFWPRFPQLVSGGEVQGQLKRMRVAMTCLQETRLQDRLCSSITYHGKIVDMDQLKGGLICLDGKI